MTPTPSSPLDALIAELERATEGSRELDAAIAAVLVAETSGMSVISNLGKDGFGPYDYSFRNYPAQGIKPEYRRVPSFTCSLDAALTLVPEGWEWQLRATGASLTTYSRDPSEYRKEHADGATAPLALCIASLKARARREDHG